MAMSVGDSDEGVMSDINTTPLVDVMLVLLIIFLIAVPVVIKTVKVTIPKLSFQPTVSKAENVILSVLADDKQQCHVYWNTTEMKSNELYERSKKKFEAESKRLGDDATDPDLFPEVHIRGDVNTPYKCIGGVISIMQSAGFIRVGFISSPNMGV
jgi:biopolymer transport protein ExbD